MTECGGLPSAFRPSGLPHASGSSVPANAPPELATQGLEAWAPAKRIAVELVAAHLQALRRRPPFHDIELSQRDVERDGRQQRQARLAHHRRENHGVHGHRQGEAAGQAKADGADAPAAAFGVRKARQLPQPVRNRTAAVRGQYIELPRDAEAKDAQRIDHLLVGRVRRAEEDRRIDAQPGVA